MAFISILLLQELNDGHRDSEAKHHKKDKKASAVKLEVASEDDDAAKDLKDEAAEGSFHHLLIL